jgi:Uma2 family endonuclease
MSSSFTLDLVWRNLLWGHAIVTVSFFSMSSYHARQPVVTAAEFALLPDEDGRQELVRGRVVREPPAGGYHSWFGVNLAAALRDFAGARQLGYVFGADCGFRLAFDPDTVRSPDLAFVRAARLPEGPPAGFVPFAPDLAVEIVSPTDARGALARKAAEYLRAGTLLVWIIDPAARTVTVPRAAESPGVLRTGDTLTAEELLPGFRLPVADLLPRS